MPALSVKTENREFIDKKFVKLICRCIYFFGLGDCWHEPMDQTVYTEFLYPVWCVICISYMLAIVVSEYLAQFKDDLTDTERSDGIQFCLAQTSGMLKFLVLYYKRQKIKDLLQMLIDGTRVALTAKTEAAAVRKAKVFIGVLVGTMAICMLFITVDALMRHFEEGTPMRTVVADWPSPDDRGILVDICRFFLQLQWWWVLSGVITLDALCLTCMIFLEYKFQTLILFFEELGSLFDAHGKTRTEMEEQYKNQFLAGVKLHTDTLQCVRDLQGSLGSIYSIQVVQSTALITICLVKLVRSVRSFSFLVASGTTILCLLTLTGTYMVAAGDMTHQASLLPPAVFRSGWERSRSRSRLRAPLLVALQCSQRPVVVTSFGMFQLSHSNFIQILRLSYSFFAVTY